MEALVKGTAAILEHIKADPLMTMGHREYATPRGRKIDPTFDMNDFRELVDVEMESTDTTRSEEHTSELQSLMRISYAVFCLKKKKEKKQHHNMMKNKIARPRA